MLLGTIANFPYLDGHVFRATYKVSRDDKSRNVSVSIWNTLLWLKSLSQKREKVRFISGKPLDWTFLKRSYVTIKLV